MSVLEDTRSSARPGIKNDAVVKQRTEAHGQRGPRLTSPAHGEARLCNTLTIALRL